MGLKEHMQKIESLPDYPALRQAQNALWRIGEVHGAAVMIGAGFSQFADRTADTTPLAPLWLIFRRPCSMSSIPREVAHPIRWR